MDLSRFGGAGIEIDGDRVYSSAQSLHDIQIHPHAAHGSKGHFAGLQWSCNDKIPFGAFAVPFRLNTVPTGIFRFEWQLPTDDFCFPIGNSFAEISDFTVEVVQYDDFNIAGFSGGDDVTLAPLIPLYLFTL